jgi:hypothetical protein
VTFTITAINPLDHADEIKRLFVDHDRPDFPEFFDRAYRAGVRGGGVSWIGRDDAGRVIMHAACFPQRFRFGAREVVGGRAAAYRVRPAGARRPDCRNGADVGRGSRAAIAALVGDHQRRLRQLKRPKLRSGTVSRPVGLFALRPSDGGVRHTRGSNLARGHAATGGAHER